ncbi:hypothetical protein [Nocardioides zeae]
MPPFHRPRGLIVLALLLVVGFALLGGVLFASAGDRVSVVAVAGSVAEGEVIERSDLTEALVSGVDGVPYSEVDDLVGQVAVVDLLDGQVVTTASVSSDTMPGRGQAVVGLALEAARAPATGLEPGDSVDVIAVSGLDDLADGAGNAQEALDVPRVLSEGAQVLALGGGAGGTTPGGQLIVTLVVGEEDAHTVAAYSTANQVAIVETAPRQKDGQP